MTSRHPVIWFRYSHASQSTERLFIASAIIGMRVPCISAREVMYSALRRSPNMASARPATLDMRATSVEVIFIDLPNSSRLHMSKSEEYKELGRWSSSFGIANEQLYDCTSAWNDSISSLIWLERIKPPDPPSVKCRILIMGPSLGKSQRRSIRQSPTSHRTLETRPVQPAPVCSQAQCPPWTTRQSTLSPPTCAEDTEAILGQSVSVVACISVFARNVTMIARMIAVIAAAVVERLAVSRRHHAAKDPRRALLSLDSRGLGEIGNTAKGM